MPIDPNAPRRLAAGGRVVLASHNRGKLAEFGAVLGAWDITVLLASDIGLPEPDETEDSFAGNARLKALAAAKASMQPSLADDSGFAVDALGGAPGIFSARWAGPEKDFAAAMRRIHHEAAANPDHSAAFVCALCLAWPDGHVVEVERTLRGEWVWPPRGSGGFGYDPMFAPRGSALTFGEMSREAKAAISHRALAIADLAAMVRPL